MRKLKYVLLFLIIYLYLDYQSYYYGFGKGYFSKKLPHGYTILFSGSDLGNAGIVLKEPSMGVHLIMANKVIELEPSKTTIAVRKVVGYYFSDSSIIVEILDKNNNKQMVEIISQPENEKRNGYTFYKKGIINGNFRFVDVNKSLAFFKTFRLIKTLSLVSLIVSFVIFSMLMMKSIMDRKCKRTRMAGEEPPEESQ